MIDSEYRERMYDVLDLYEEEYNPENPLVCFDEKPKQLIGAKRTFIPIKPGSPEKYDYEYVRNGTANIFVAVELESWETGDERLTKRRTMVDFAQFVKILVDEIPRR